MAKRHQPHTSIVADTLNLPHPDAAFDFAISIAVVHHLSTSARRIQAIQGILQTVKPTTDKVSGGRVLIFAWALEQKTSRRGWDVGHKQDVMVPWVMKEKKDHGQTPTGGGDRTYHRYYHLYRSGELEGDIAKARGTVIDSGYERDNWWAIAVRRE